MDVCEEQLIQRCRICDVSTADGDFVPLFINSGNEIENTYSGELYEELMQLRCTVTTNYPYVCSSCDLQMKLFKRLKDKAWKMMLKVSESIMVQTNENDVKSAETLNNDIKNKSESSKQQISSDHNLETFFKNDASKNNTTDFEETSNHTKNIENMENIYIVYDLNSPSVQEVDIDEVIEYQEEKDDKDCENSIDNINLIVEDVMIEEDKNEYTEVHYVNVVAENDDLIDNSVMEEKLIKDKPKKVRVKSSETDCKDCNINFTSLRLLKIHRQEKHGRTYLCKKCQKLFKSAENLESHMRLHLGLPAFSCNLCNRTFNQKVHYHTHIKRHTNNRDFECKICSKTFFNKSDLKTHMRMHTQERRFVCTYENCGKSFYNDQHLKYHLYVHSGQKNFECNLCLRKFVAPNALATHMRTMHSSTKQYACPKCDKQFRRKHILEVHLAVHAKHENPTQMSSNNYYKLNDGVLGMEIINLASDHDDNNESENNVISIDTIDNYCETDNEQSIDHTQTYKYC